MPRNDELTEQVVSKNEERLQRAFVRGLAGDAAAYRDFLLLLSGHLRAFLRRRLARLPQDVEDLVQETLLAVHNQRHTYDAGQPLTAWVHAIARYKLVDFLRRRAVRDALNDSLDDVSELTSECDTEATEARRDLDRLLERLPPSQRALVVRLKVDGQSVAEVARSSGMSEAAVKVAVHRALRRLSMLIREADEDR
ncbi:MAG: sigma-70 family RNA polymerase sigma factor [Burkholderiales bacterium]